VIQAAPILGAAATYLAARHLGAWAAAIVSGLGALAIGRTWSRRAATLDAAVLHFANLARTDDLTGLANDRSFRDRIGASSVPPLSLILIDVDGFKTYNDAHGHPAGDEALRALAEVLRAEAPSSGQTFRVGGDEFAVLLPGVDPQAARAVADRLRSSVEAHPWPLRPLTASFGVASTAGDDRDPSSLRSRADRALYRAKGRGRDRVADHADGTSGPG
jgi:diguanylate cyclase (GGDEF)-like protein